MSHAYIKRFKDKKIILQKLVLFPSTDHPIVKSFKCSDIGWIFEKNTHYEIMGCVIVFPCSKHLTLLESTISSGYVAYSNIVSLKLIVRFPGPESKPF